MELSKTNKVVRWAFLYKAERVPDHISRCRLIGLCALTPLRLLAIAGCCLIFASVIVYGSYASYGIAPGLVVVGLTTKWGLDRWDRSAQRRRWQEWKHKHCSDIILTDESVGGEGQST